MATKIKLKKSSVSGNTPGTGDLVYGELALNFADGKLFYKNSSNQIKSFVDSALVESLISANSVDSSQVLSLVDSDYIELRKPADVTFAVAAGAGIYNFTKDGFPSSTSNPTLHLQRGLTYHFEVNASGHPFYINTTNTTGTGSAYNDGVTNNGAATGTIKFTVPMDAPSTLHYNCQYHSSMNGPIYITDSSVTSGIDSAATISLIDSAYVAARAPIDSAATISLIDSAYIQDRQMGVGFALYEYNATDNQTTFEDSDIAGNVLSYSQNNILVHYNGILLSTTEYTATDGSTVVLEDGADSGAIVMIARYAEGGQDTASENSGQYGGGGGGGGGSGPTWSGDRGLMGGGETSNNGTSVNVITYIDISSTGNAQDFGDLTVTRENFGALSNQTRGVFCGGNSDGARQNVMDYVTIATTGNAQDFGDLTTGKSGTSATSSNGTIGIIAGGVKGGSYPSSYTNDIESITVATTGNSSDFGDLTYNGWGMTSFSDATRGVIAGGYTTASAGDATMNYITFASAGNAQDFGDLSQGRYSLGSFSDATRGVIGGGSTPSSNGVTTIDYVATQTTGNATDFGDLTQGRRTAGMANATRGVFASGDTNTTFYDILDYVTIQTAGNAVDFGDNTDAYGKVGSCSGNAS